MEQTISQEQWGSFFQEFSQRNRGRATRLEILDENGVQIEEHGLPFAGMDLDTKGSTAPIVEIRLAEEGLEGRHLLHPVPQARMVMVKIGADGSDEVLDIESEEATRTLLYFEGPPSP